MDAPTAGLEGLQTQPTSTGASSDVSTTGRRAFKGTVGGKACFVCSSDRDAIHLYKTKRDAVAAVMSVPPSACQMV